jgi:hypothetical protein
VASCAWATVACHLQLFCMRICIVYVLVKQGKNDDVARYSFFLMIR